jgi:hypothetical protein
MLWEWSVLYCRMTRALSRPFSWKMQHHIYYRTFIIFSFPIYVQWCKALGMLLLLMERPHPWVVILTADWLVAVSSPLCLHSFEERRKEERNRSSLRKKTFVDCPLRRRCLLIQSLIWNRKRERERERDCNRVFVIITGFYSRSDSNFHSRSPIRVLLMPRTHPFT